MTAARRAWLLERLERIEHRGRVRVEEVYPMLGWLREALDAVEVESWQDRLPGMEAA